MSEGSQVEAAFGRLMALVDDGANFIEISHALEEFAQGLDEGERAELNSRIQVYFILVGRIGSGVSSFGQHGITVPDLTITIRSANSPIYVESRKEALNFSGKEIGPLKNAEEILRTVRDEIARLYQSDGDASDMRRRFDALSVRVTEMIPEQLRQWLDAGAVKSVALNVGVSADFPLELCRLPTAAPDGSRILCDRIEVSRWFLDTGAQYPRSRRSIRHIAFVEGDLKDGFGEEEAAVLSGTGRSAHSLNLRAKEAVNEMFRNENIDLLHYKGHIDNPGGGAEPELSMADGDAFPLAYVDVAVSDKEAFFTRDPVVFLNGCDASVPSPLIGGDRNFPYSLCRGNAAAIVSTLWQVGEDPAGEFSRAFYASLRSGHRLGAAMNSGRKALEIKAKEFEEAKDGERFKLYHLAKYSYIYHGPHDLSLHFH